MKNKKMASNLLLLLTAFIWGVAFVSQKKGTESVGPFTFVSARYLLSAIFIFILIKIRDRKNPPQKYTSEQKSNTLKAIISCGICISGGAILQQFGLVFTTAGKAAFITSLYILILPIVGIFMGKKIHLQSWIAVLLGAIGLYLLTVKEGFTIQQGDFVVLIGALFWAGHILFIDHAMQKDVDALVLSCGQMVVVFIISMILMLIFESPDIESLKEAFVPIFYAGVFSGGLGFTFQIIGQKNADPVVASILMSMESAFGAISGAIILGERMVPKELFGSVLLFSAVILSQLNFEKKSAS